MKKVLITKTNLDKYIKDNELNVTENLIISPGVFDILRNRNIKIIYGKKDGEEETLNSNSKINKKEDLESKVRKILEEDYKDIGSTVINKVSKHVVDIINNK